jgi:AcrR family transcriptional regulator
MCISSKRLKILQKEKSSDDADDTRTRLIESAAAIFALRGYQATTTREICIRAHANPAAVNYHFGDKLGLYKAALKSVIALCQESGVEMQALSSMPPEQALHSFIEAMFDNLGAPDAEDHYTHYTRLMAHELSDPTPGLTLVVKQIIAPRARLLSRIVARLTGDSENSLATRLAAHSIMAQVVHYVHARPVIKILWPKWRLNADARRQMVDHVARFSLAGLEAMARGRRPRKSGAGKAAKRS